MPKDEDVWLLIVESTTSPGAKIVGAYGSEEAAKEDVKLYNPEHWSSKVEKWKVEI